MAITVRVVRTPPSRACAGTGGLDCQMPGLAATVSSLALSTGGIRPGGMVETD